MPQRAAACAAAITRLFRFHARFAFMRQDAAICRFSPLDVIFASAAALMPRCRCYAMPLPLDAFRYDARAISPRLMPRRLIFLLSFRWHALTMRYFAKMP